MRYPSLCFAIWFAAKRDREEIEAIAEEAARKEMRNHHRRLGSTVVPSHDLRRVANSRGEAAKASPSEFGLTREPSNTTVSLTLTPTQLQAARTNGVAAHGGQYRSEEGRGGKEVARTCRSRRSTYH